MEQGTNPEVLLISAVLRQGDHITPMAQGINASLFHTYHDEWRWIEQYITRHRRTPSKAAFKAKFPGVRIKAVDDVEHFGDEVKDAHARYSIIEIMETSAKGIQSGEPMKQVTAGMHQALLNLQGQIEGTASEAEIISNWQDIYDDVASRVDRVNDKGIAGVPTGFPTLDALTGGAAPGDYWVIAARLGQGKTWTAVRMACAAVWDGYTVQYDSLEQTRAQIALRAHTFMSNKYGRTFFRSLDLAKGKGFDLREYHYFLKRLPSKMEGKFFINDTSRGRVSVATIAAQIERNHPNIVFVDYLTLMERPGDDWQGVANLSAEMKTLAQRYQLPIVVISQINRAGIGREPPGPEHLSQADAIGQDADAVVTMKQMSPHVMKMRLAKYRHGQDGQLWWVKFDPSNGSMEEVTGDKAQETMDLDREDD